MGGMMGDLTENVRSAINEVLLIAALAATATAVLVSSFVTRRIVSPIEEMTEASQRIAGGHYDERVLVVGAGGLGSPVLRLLASSGAAHVTIIDDDVVDESNLHRQTLYSSGDLFTFGFTPGSPSVAIPIPAAAAITRGTVSNVARSVAATPNSRLSNRRAAATACTTKRSR